MAFNLLDTVRGYLTPSLVERTSSYLGESPTGINKALTAVIPAVLAMFTNRAERGNAQGLLNDAYEAADSNVLNQPQRLFSGEMSSFLTGGLSRLENLFGSNATNVLSSIANFAGIKSGTVQGLMGIVAPIGLGVIGRHARENNLSAQGLTTYLSSQKSDFLNALPAGISLENVLDEPVRNSRTTTITGETPRMARVENVPEKRKSNVMAWLLLGLGAIALIWLLNRNRNDDSTRSSAKTNITTTENRAAKAPVTTTTDVANRAPVRVRLVNGVEINAYKGGIEDRLVNCLNDASCTAGKEKWFDFDNINFETGSAQLTSSSQMQVRNIVAILNAYPNAKIKIGGYTDKTGNDAANKTLSQQRAEAVMNAIKNAGAKTNQVVGAEGYGASYAKVPASASDEERRQDRRIAVQLRNK
jgi:outer membrane protein OmpA-like peptidoglycan-associated protein